MSSDKIEKNNKKIHTESSYAYFPIFFHICIFAVCCVSAARKKGWERETRTHDSPRLHMYIFYLCFVFCCSSFFLLSKTAVEEKKNITKISTAPKSITSNTNNRQRRNRAVKLALCAVCIKICRSA